MNNSGNLSTSPNTTKSIFVRFFDFIKNFFFKFKNTIIIISILLILVIVLMAVFKVNIKDLPNSIIRLFKGQSKKNVFENNDKEVFNIKTNMFTFDEAKLVCKAYGAEMATLDQLVDAHKQGANWCNYGWTQEQLALYPIQKTYIEQLKKEGREGQCGLPGLNGGYFANPFIKFGANCYGIKPNATESEKLKFDLNSKLSSDIDEKKLQKIKEQINDMQILPFNSEKWSLN